MIELVFEPDRPEHIARHGVTIDEVFEVAEGRYVRTKMGAGRTRLIGRTSAGRYLMVLVGQRAGRVHGLITARDATLQERRLFLRS